MGFQLVRMCIGSGVEQGVNNPTPSLKSKLRPPLSPASARLCNLEQVTCPLCLSFLVCI